MSQVPGGSLKRFFVFFFVGGAPPPRKIPPTKKTKFKKPIEAALEEKHALLKSVSDYHHKKHEHSAASSRPRARGSQGYPGESLLGDSFYESPYSGKRRGKRIQGLGPGAKPPKSGGLCLEPNPPILDASP